MARSARARPPRRPRIRIRSKASVGEFACSVHIEPSWPEFIASSIGMISPRLTSPTRIRRGLCRSACAIRSCRLMPPAPSEFASRASNAITSGCVRQLVQVKLVLRFQRGDPFTRRNLAGQRAQQRCLAGVDAAGDDDVAAAPHRRCKERCHRGVDRAELR